MVCERRLVTRLCVKEGVCDNVVCVKDGNGSGLDRESDTAANICQRKVNLKSVISNLATTQVRKRATHTQHLHAQVSGPVETTAFRDLIAEI